MTSPAHKVVGDEHKPGQQRNERFLNEYIARRADNFNYAPKECCGNPLRGCTNCPPPKKLSFDEWYEERTKEFDERQPVTWVDFELVARQAWEASKENM